MNKRLLSPTEMTKNYHNPYRRLFICLILQAIIEQDHKYLLSSVFIAHCRLLGLLPEYVYKKLAKKFPEVYTILAVKEVTEAVNPIVHYTEKTSAKVSKETLELIREDYNKGLQYNIMANKYSLSVSSIQYIIKKITQGNL